jgi:heat-inducible transcriptional repressor
MSSATVRNEMLALTEMGYLRQAHTSAGRTPSEQGYRYFVGRLLHETEVPDDTRRMISHQFYQMHNDVEQWMRLGASVLASQSHGASLITAPHPEHARLKHIELIVTRARQILMVMVMIGGEIHQRIVNLDEPTTQDQLSSAAMRLNALLEGKDAGEIQAQQATFSTLESDVVEWLVYEMNQANALPTGQIYLDGLANVLSEPDFSGVEEARRALTVLEERTRLQDLLSRTVMTSTIGSVQVLIGGEGTWDELRSCSVVLARYGTPGLATGTLGVLGPMRMPYGRTISTVRFVAGLLSDLISEIPVD